MIDRQIIYGGRGSGKTYKMMTEIYELAKSGERSDILVIFPSMNYLHFWQREWERRFPYVPMVAYTSLQAMDRVRNRTFKYVYVEDIDEQSGGIYDDKLVWLYPSMQHGGTITFTCGNNKFSDVSHQRV